VAAEVGAILLAAGASRRMGEANKLLLEVDGVPMVARVAAAIEAAGLPMLVVLGWEAELVGAALTYPPPIGGRGMRSAAERGRGRGSDAGQASARAHVPSPCRFAAVPPPGRGRVEVRRFVVAPNWAEGMGASLAAGVRAVPADWTGALVCLGDMPFVSAELLVRLATALDGPDAVAVPVHAGRRGNPVGWSSAWFPRLATLGGDAGGRGLLEGAQAIEVPADAAIHRDLDTPGDLLAR